MAVGWSRHEHASAYPVTRPPPAGRQAPPVPAVVMGNVDLLRPLAMAGIRCVLVAPPDDPVRHSRMVDGVIPAPADWEACDDLLDELTAYGLAQPRKPVLFYQYDEHLLLVSRHRERLAEAFRFVIADPTQVEDLVHKERFEPLARRFGLPTPPTTVLTPHEGSQPPAGPEYPVIVKPDRRSDALWASVEPAAKAVRVDSAEEMRRLWPRLIDARADFIAQTLIAGPESRIESYHCYVDDDGETVAEFTGAKIRTWPEHYGHTTALSVEKQHDTRDAGRAVVAALGLRGVSKTDFKR